MKATYARDNDYDRYYEHQDKELEKKHPVKSSKSKALENKKKGVASKMGNSERAKKAAETRRKRREEDEYYAEKERAYINGEEEDDGSFRKRQMG